MNMSDRIQYLRKTKGISQEELADKVGVSRQAVSKWESEQSMPELDKVILMSEIFDVTTDYILRGIEPVIDKDAKGNEQTSQILYIGSVAMVAIGLLCMFGGWYEEQTMEAVWGSMIIQAAGVAGYFIGKLLSASKPPIAVKLLNIAMCAFAPISMVSGMVSIAIFRQGGVAPYPVGVYQIMVFAVLFLAVCGVSFWLLKKQENKKAL